MKKLPHTYEVSMQQEGPLGILESENAPHLVAGAPPQFGGRDDTWSPETLFLASIGQCLFLTFVAIARMNKLQFHSFTNKITGTLARTDTGLQFTEVQLQVQLQAEDPEMAQQLLEKSEKQCLISNSIRCPVKLQVQAGRLESTGSDSEP